MGKSLRWTGGKDGKEKNKIENLAKNCQGNDKEDEEKKAREERVQL